MHSYIGISGIVRKATDVTMRAESSILELVETADGLAMAAPVREIAVWCQAAMACEAKPNPAAGGHRF